MQEAPSPSGAPSSTHHDDNDESGRSEDHTMDIGEETEMEVDVPVQEMEVVNNSIRAQLPRSFGEQLTDEVDVGADMLHTDDSTSVLPDEALPQAQEVSLKMF